MKRTAMIAGLAAVLLASGCDKKNIPAKLPPPEVGVIRLAASHVTVYEEFSGQTEAVDTVEIRARVGGILERVAATDGARVKRGELLYEIDRQPFIAALAQARANLVQAQAAHLNSMQNLKRARPLFADNAISRQEFDATSAKEAADAANIVALNAVLEQARLSLGYATLRAPRDGVISRALVKQGGLVNASTTLLNTLYSEDPIYVNFSISDRKLAELGMQRGSFAAGANPASFGLRLVDGSEYNYPGKLDFVDAAFDSRTGTLPVRISVSNPQRALKPGQYLRVILPAYRIPDAIRVPQKAVMELQGKQSVFVLGADNKVAARDIVASRRIEHDWIVDSGLKAGETIVVEGMPKIKPGDTVTPARPNRG